MIFKKKVAVLTENYSAACFKTDSNKVKDQYDFSFIGCMPFFEMTQMLLQSFIWEKKWELYTCDPNNTLSNDGNENLIRKYQILIKNFLIRQLSYRKEQK